MKEKYLGEGVYMHMEEADSKLIKKQFLKSLGLYWRKWPEEKPEMPMECIIKTKNGLHYGEWENICNFNYETIGQEWDTTDHLIAPRDGDQWLPLAALKVLNEMEEE
jgi:hypothetical protein